MIFCSKGIYTPGSEVEGHLFGYFCLGIFGRGPGAL